MEKVSLRERKKTRTWENLVKISTRLFLEQGYDNTTIDQIVEQAELSQRTFFRYFPSKEAVLFRDFKWREQVLLEFLAEETNGDNPYERIRRSLLGMARTFESERETLLTEYTIVMGSRHLIALDIEQDSRLEKHISNALREWRGKPFLSALQGDVVAGAIFGSIRSAMGHWFEGGCQDNLERLSGECLKVVDLMSSGFPGK